MNWQQILNEAINFLLYPEFSGWLFNLKIVFLGFGSLFLGYILWALFKTSWLKRIFLWDLKEFFSWRPYFAKIFASEWKKIEKRIESQIEADLKLAILEADELLNKCLTEIGYSGATLDEKLEKISKDTISNLEILKKARQTRNDIIEDPTFKLSFEDTKMILSIYKKALQDLHVL